MSHGSMKETMASVNTEHTIDMVEREYIANSLYFEHSFLNFKTAKKRYFLLQKATFGAFKLIKLSQMVLIP